MHQRFTPWKFNMDTTNWCCAKCNFISKIAIFGYLYQMYSKFQGRKYWKSNQLKCLAWKIEKYLAAPERISLCACRQFLDRPEKSAVRRFQIFTTSSHKLPPVSWKSLLRAYENHSFPPKKKRPSGALCFWEGGTWNGVDPVMIFNHCRCPQIFWEKCKPSWYW